MTPLPNVRMPRPLLPLPLPPTCRQMPAPTPGVSRRTETQAATMIDVGDLGLAPSIEMVTRSGFPLHIRSQPQCFTFEKIFRLMVVRVQHDAEVEGQPSLDIANSSNRTRAS